MQEHPVVKNATIDPLAAIETQEVFAYKTCQKELFDCTLKQD
jgi:hypothetical protein